MSSVFTSVLVKCKLCDKEFFVQPHRFKTGRGKFCSVKCRANSVSPETKLKMSLKKKGIKVPKLQGSLCHFWKGGITPINKSIRTSLEYRLWRESVYIRDNYICQICKKRGGKLQADHIKPFSKYPELRFDINNGRTLCIECHRKTETYGSKVLKIIR